MIVIVFLLIISLLVAIGFLIAFIWGSKTGQFDDSFTPANKILFDQTNQPTENK
jgi:cbb3-type cytochrome oxidase maturation protein